MTKTLFADDSAIAILQYDDSTRSHRTVGYGFATGAAGNENRTEHWVLLPAYVRYPVGQARFRAPSDESAGFDSLSQWLPYAQSKWTSGSKYVKTNLVAYDDIPTTVVVPSYPEPTEIAPVGLDSGTVGIWDGIKDTKVGDLFAVTVEGHHVNEFWVLRNEFEPSPTGQNNLIRMDSSGGGEWSDLDSFLTDQRSSWQAGSTFLVGASNFYDAIPSGG